MPKISQRRLEARRRGIVRAAARCVARRGVAGTGMREVFRASNLSPGAVYRYFAGKRELLAAVAAEAPLAADRLVGALDGEEDPARLLRVAAEGGEAERLELGLRAAALDDEGLGSVLAARRRASLEELAASDAVRRRARRLGWTAERLARLLLAVADGLWLTALLEPAEAAGQTGEDAARLLADAERVRS